MRKNAKRSSSWKYQGRIEERKGAAPILASTSFHLHAEAPEVTYTPELDDEPAPEPEPVSPAAREAVTPARQAETAPVRQWPSHLATGAPSVRAFRANPNLFVPPIGIPADKGARAGATSAPAGVVGHLRPNIRSNAPVYTFGEHPGRRALPPPGVTAMAPPVSNAATAGAARLAGGASVGVPAQAKIAAPKARPVMDGESGPRVYTYGTCQSCQDD
ncbi:MAG TPA: hypothetical protein VFK80_05240 [Limnochordia bacterium]|nr:hypothetical protein [Limnochordia bacterium]